MSINSYSKFISEQSRMQKVILSKEEKLDEFISGYSPSSNKEPKENSEITKKVRAHTKDPEASHIGATKEGHHVYAHGDTSDGGKNLYAVYHPDDKITTHHVKHGGNSTSARELSKPADFHDVNKLPSSVRSIIHKDLKDNVDDYYN